MKTEILENEYIQNVEDFKESELYSSALYSCKYNKDILYLYEDKSLVIIEEEEDFIYAIKIEEEDFKEIKQDTDLIYIFKNSKYKFEIFLEKEETINARREREYMSFF